MSKIFTKLGQPMVKPSAKPRNRVTIDESKAVVNGGGDALRLNQSGAHEIVAISSDSESGGEDDSDVDDEDDDAQIIEDEETKQVGDADTAMADTEEAQDNGEPSFGDLAAATFTETIDVAAFDRQSTAVTNYPRTQIQAPAGASLGAVLTQALKTNDTALLESCLHTSDLNTIRATIQRLESPLAGPLLTKLAERLHRRPGRSGPLMTWVQWTLVMHGGYLATLGDLQKRLVSLNKVLDARSKGMASMLSLKGKLDMLEAQTSLRKDMQAREQIQDDGDEEGVIYVEGEESEEEGATPQKLLQNGHVSDSEGESDASEDLVDDAVSDDSEDDSSDGEDGGLIDDEAEETDADSGDEDEVDHEDPDSENDDSDDGRGGRPSKIQKTSNSFVKRK